MRYLYKELSQRVDKGKIAVYNMGNKCSKSKNYTCKFGGDTMFNIVSDFIPTGDQPQAIEGLSRGLISNMREQTLLGVTGSGKTFTIANTIARVNKPTLVLAHNKTLAAQLCSEFKEFFPNSAVEYFVSYYDYYQPEAYIPQTDTFIEKDAQINDEIDKLRHSATSALIERRDVIVVSSVSCIYSLGDPEDYARMVVSLRPGMEKDRDDVISSLVDIQYDRNDINFTRGKFRVRGDVLEVFPASSGDKALRVEFFGDEIERISEIDVLTGEILGLRNHAAVYPASHYVTTKDKMEKAIAGIQQELEIRGREFESENKILEMQRIISRTNYDIEMMREIGFCQGIENYSRYINDRAPGSAPYTLMDYFPDDYLLVVDESHVTIPQVRAMYAGDRARKDNLIQYGFRLPSAYDNRPLNFEEFNARINNVIYVSATPAVYERSRSSNIVEQVIRPTGLLDPEVLVRPVKGQIEDLLGEIYKRTEKKERVLVTTLTKKMAEDLTDYLREMGVAVKYMHHDVETIERMEIIRDLRLGVFDVLVGINLLREGLDLPEVSLVTILDADKEGFLRSETSLIQTIGRAARNVEGTVIMYADKITGSMERAIKETERRRKIQKEYNETHNITPTTIKKSVREVIEATVSDDTKKPAGPIVDKEILIEKLLDEMHRAAGELRFEEAAGIRDKIKRLKGETDE